MTPIIKRFVIKLLSKDQGSGITKLPWQMQAGFQESMVTEKLIRKNSKIRFRKIIIDKNVSKVSIIGVGMITTPGVTYRMFKALAKNKINIQVISTSEIKISVLINKKLIKKAINSLHKEFNLYKWASDLLEI